MYTGTYQDTNDWSVNQLRKEKQKKNKQSLWDNLVITKKSTFPVAALHSECLHKM